MHTSFMVLSQHLNEIEVRTLTRSLQHPDSFSVIDLPLCFQSILLNVPKLGNSSFLKYGLRFDSSVYFGIWRNLWLT